MKKTVYMKLGKMSRDHNDEERELKIKKIRGERVFQIKGETKSG